MSVRVPIRCIENTLGQFLLSVLSVRYNTCYTGVVETLGLATFLELKNVRRQIRPDKTRFILGE